MKRPKVEMTWWRKHKASSMKKKNFKRRDETSLTKPRLVKGLLPLSNKERENMK
jgi:hypothetical protein